MEYRTGTAYEVISHLYIGDSVTASDSNTLSESNIHYLLSFNPCAPSRRKLLTGTNVKGHRRVCVTDTLLELVEDTNDFIHFARVNKENILVYSLCGVSLSTAMIALYLKAISDLTMRDILKLMKLIRPEDDLYTFNSQLSYFGKDIWLQENLRLQKMWGEESVSLNHRDLVMFAHLEMSKRFEVGYSTSDSEQQYRHKKPELLGILKTEQLRDIRRREMEDAKEKEENAKKASREAMERNFMSMYMQTLRYTDYKMSYEFHEFDEFVFDNAVHVDRYLPSAIDDVLND